MKSESARGRTAGRKKPVGILGKPRGRKAATAARTEAGRARPLAAIAQRTSPPRLRHAKGQSETGATDLAALARFQDGMRDLQRRCSTLDARLQRLDKQVQASELALAAAQLQALNERQAREGLDRLRTDLRAMIAEGILDDQGEPRGPGEVPRGDTCVV